MKPNWTKKTKWKMQIAALVLMYIIAIIGTFWLEFGVAALILVTTPMFFMDLKKLIKQYPERD